MNLFDLLEEDSLWYFIVNKPIISVFVLLLTVAAGSLCCGDDDSKKGSEYKDRWDNVKLYSLLEFHPSDFLC
ncbi:CLUMA_CG020788, isoform A [Clunio marinus]|uniref:CLUMA_CG020788, isoform A n=1 Tax=Clunio marinus TaxID=568069 RepID=A0A1J1J774_9DIPT|nr:CLUMA_CG020788, isoform A [Clunio marinus]